MTLSTDDVLQELRTVSPTDSVDSLLVRGALAPGRVEADSAARSSSSASFGADRRRRHAASGSSSLWTALFRGRVTSEHASGRRYRLPHVLGSPLYGAVAILILILALSTSLTLLLIQAVNISRLDTPAVHSVAIAAPEEKKEQASAPQTPVEAPAQSPVLPQPQVASASAAPSAPAAPAAPSAPSAPAADPAPVSAPEAAGVNVNTASKEELEQIPGVGPVTAQRILDYRTAHGAFSSIDQLTRVSGIGTKTLEKMRNHVRVQ
ncbi:ComEA family DNA-binding protein [Alloscardovia macacae]|nr:helix-hairpin-helix domain-containing protein [Alloscardovia macacae]